MQHTLIPSQERKALRREYRTRALVVFFFLISVAGVIGIASLFPAFLEARYDEASAKALIDSNAKKDQSAIAEIEQKLLLDNSLLSTLSDGIDVTPMSSSIQDLASMRGDVRLAAITVSRQASSSVDITVSGHAPTRDSLLAFKKRVESAHAGNKVDLPVSQLAESTNINFTIHISEP